MSDQRPDDEILGRALSRAIETIDVNETPYERSRVATTPARRSIFGLWQMATAAAAIVLALAIGSWLARPIENQPGVAGSPTAPAATSSAPPSATASPKGPSALTGVDHDKIYLARPALPPIAVSWLMSGSATMSPAERIGTRLNGLSLYQQSVPGLTNYLAKNNFGSPGGGSAQVAIGGDLATVDLHLGAPLNASSHTEALGILQQLVYTATEEPGIRRVLFTQNGGQPLSIGDIKVDKPLAREDVFGYSATGPIGKDSGISWGGNDSLPHIGGQLVGPIVDGTTARLTIAGRSAESGARAELPSFTLRLAPSDDTIAREAKYRLSLLLQWNGGGASGGAAGTTIYDQTPLRAITSNGNNSFEFELDDARPWRAYMPDKTQVVIEIGGDPRATSDRISVTEPKPGDRTPGGAQFAQTVRLVGAARVFEANVSWRVRDSSGKIVATSRFNASLGNASLWGTFDNGFAVPASVHGNITLEVYEVSPKDGSDQGLVAIPLTVP
jgi:hypothetical protein